MGALWSFARAEEPAPEDPGPAASDLSLEDVFGPERTQDPSATTPAGGVAPAEGEEPERRGAETPTSASEDPADISMDDIFGSDPAGASDSEEAGQRGTAAPPDLAPRDATSKPATKAADVVRRHVFDHLDLRFRLVSSVYFAVAKTDQRRIERNENRLEFRLAYTPNRHLELVGDVEAVFFGVAQTPTLDDISSQRLLTPFHFESDAAYVGIYDLIPNLDIKIGRQIVQWGTADKFNPTNNINADDLEDRPLFTEPIANQMVVLEWSPLQDNLWFQGVYVPMFFPALLPPSAGAALQDPQGPVPFARPGDVSKIEAARGLFRYEPGLIPTVTSTVVQPRFRFVDGQSAVKVGSNFGGLVDVSASYYNGRHDIPAPVTVQSSFKEDATGEPGTPGCCVQSHVTLVYPRIQVIGLDFATQLPFAGNMGVWGEAALFFPSSKDLFIAFPRPQDVTPDDGVTNPVSAISGPSIESRPYLKATAGLDYTFGKHVYVQAQYLRGFIDEIGASHIGNYLFGGTELAFLGRHLLVRLFGVVDLPRGKSDRASYVVYPALMFKPPWGYATLELGSFFLLGRPETKFGQKAAGSSIVFAKVVGEF